MFCCKDPSANIVTHVHAGDRVSKSPSPQAIPPIMTANLNADSCA
jgi:hypothetical protein